MPILPTTSTFSRTEKARQYLSSLVNMDDIPGVLSGFQQLHQELKPIEEKALKNHDQVAELWHTAIRLDSPHLLLSLIRAQWTPLLKVHYPQLGLEQPLSWGWIACHQRAPQCFAFLMQNKDIQQGFLKDAQITPIVKTLLWYGFGPDTFEMIAQQTPLLNQKLFEGHSILHLLTQSRVWNEDETGLVDTGWMAWVQHYALHLLDEKDPFDKTAFESDDEESQAQLTAIRAELEKARFSLNLNTSEKPTLIKPKRL